MSAAPLSDREVTALVLATVLREARATAAGPHDAFITLRFDADGGVRIVNRFGAFTFADTDCFAAWLVERCQRLEAPSEACAA